MSDALLRLAERRALARLFRQAGFPLPPVLRRDASPWSERGLDERLIAAPALPGAALDRPLARALAEAGATVVRDVEAAAFIEAGQAWSRPVLAGADRLDGIVLDATGLRTVEALASLREQTGPLLGRLRSGGRVLALARPPEELVDAEAAASQRAVEGFVRSLARELGRKGGTANLLLVGEGGAEGLAGPLRFFLSDRSAFVSGVVLRLSSAVALPPPRWLRPLDGGLVLVTGAARGIGAATVRALRREGARVLALDRPGEETVLAELAGDPARALGLDLAAGETPARLVEAVEANGGRLRAVVHNAGITRDKTLGRMGPEHWQPVLDINLGAVLRAQAALDPLVEDGGRIVALSSIAGLAGNAGQTAYAASKAGIAGWVAARAPSLAARGVALNAIAPGFIETRLTAAIPLLTREFGRRLSNLSQGGLPEDVAEAVVFLCSPGAAGLSGQVLRVCGGSYLGA